MTAEADIAAIADGGENTAADVRQALTSVLDRADRGNNPFTVVLIPDTQNLSSSGTRIAHFQAAADWIEANRTDRNIQLVLHLGDVVNNGGTTEFDRAEGPMDTIWDTGVPFAVCIGNHDYDGGSPASDHSDTTNWNTYFGQDKYTGRDWWDGEFFEANKSENFYFRTSLGGRPTLVLSVEFYPRAAVLAWAGDVIEANPTHDVIILTHSYLNDDGTHTTAAAEHGPDTYFGASDASSGVDMWDEIRQYPNVVAVFSGHHINAANTAELVSQANERNLVFQQFSNWQADDEGGDGRIVLLTVNPATGWATREVYNARTESFESEYELTFRLYQVAAPSTSGVSGTQIVTGTVGDGSSTELVFQHGLGTHVLVQAFADDNGTLVKADPDTVELSEGEVTLTFSEAPAQDEITVIVVGEDTTGQPQVVDFAIGSQAGGNMDLVLPGGAPDDGDVLLTVAITRNANMGSQAPGAQWTEVLYEGGGGEFRGVWWKVADGDTDTVTVACPSGDALIGILIRLSGVSTPHFDFDYNWEPNDGGDAGNTAPSVEGEPGAILICVWGTHFDSDTYFGPATGMTQIALKNDGTGNTRMVAGFEMLEADGATGTREVQGNVNDWTFGMSMVFLPS